MDELVRTAPGTMERAGNGVRNVFEVLGVALLALVQLTFMYGVISRYVFHRPVEWADEIVIVTYLWSMFLAAAFTVTLKENVAFDMIYTALPKQGQRVMLLMGSTLVAVLLAWATPAVYAYVAFLTRERTPVLEWPLNVVYSCVVVFFVVTVLRELWRCAVLLSPKWREHL
jgi:TRAP-type C4-dicarboxylate transport system permease small subunit